VTSDEKNRHGDIETRGRGDTEMMKKTDGKTKKWRESVKCGIGESKKRRCRDTGKTSLRVPVSPCLRVITLLCILIQLIGINPAYPQKPPQFKPAFPGWRFQFPRDHRVHREFKTEWWYYTGNLQDSSGNSYGYQVTFFRAGLIPGLPPVGSSRWSLREVYLAHLAVTDVKNKNFLYQEKASRGNLGLAGAEENRYRVWVENWQVMEEGQGHRLIAGDKDLGLFLNVIPTRSPIIHGINGVSQKGPGVGQASHYYSLTRLETKGNLRIKGKEIPVSGLSWKDHEFGSNQLQESQVGWDWFSMQLDNGLDLMIYQLRHSDGRVEPHSSGTLVLPDSRTIHLPLPEIKLRSLSFWKSARSGATYPASWNISLPQHDLKLELIPLVADQELITSKSTGVTYWEGAVKIKGTHKGRVVEGKGYVEMTGYDKRFRPKI
jgi:predicted secreted hydrolase